MNDKAEPGDLVIYEKDGGEPDHLGLVLGETEGGVAVLGAKMPPEMAAKARKMATTRRPSSTPTSISVYMNGDGFASGYEAIFGKKRRNDVN